MLQVIRRNCPRCGKEMQFKENVYKGHFEREDLYECECGVKVNIHEPTGLSPLVLPQGITTAEPWHNGRYKCGKCGTDFPIGETHICCTSRDEREFLG